MNNQQQKESLRWKLRLIFLYYASYADKNNYKLLKSQNYRRFLIDSESVKQQAGFAPFDIAFRKIHTSAIKLEQFLELLPTLAQLVYVNKNRKDAFKFYIANHMEKLNQEIFAHSQFGADVKTIENLTIEKKSLDLLTSNAMVKVYQKYIEKTSMHQKAPEQTFQKLHCFLSDFQISPKLVYKAMTYLAFYYQVQNNKSKLWGIDNLQEILICFAELYWRRIEEGQAGQEDKVVRLMQQMEISGGFKKMVEQNLKQNAVSISFFKMTHRYTTQLSHSRQKDRYGSLQKSQPMSARSTHGVKSSNTKRQRQIAYSGIKELVDGESELINRMNQIFERLCSHGEVGNNQTLKSIKIKRYFKNLNILASLQQTWVDITITQLCRSSPSGKVQFPQFLHLLQVVAIKLNVDWEGFFHYLVDHSQSAPDNSTNYFSKVSNHSHSHQQKIVGILLQVQKPLQKIYNYYRVGKKGISFEQLSHLLFQFEIFPTFVNKSTLYSYFQNRSKASNQMKKLAGEVSLDILGFLEILADVSCELGDNLSTEERILFLLQRMQDSQGHRTLLGSQGSNLIGDLRSKYANVYKQNIVKNSPKKAEGFEQLLGDL